jgi:hypothetical protein
MTPGPSGTVGARELLKNVPFFADMPDSEYSGGEQCRPVR